MNCSTDPMAELARLAVWSLVWICTGGGLGDEPGYEGPNVWASWEACR